MTFLTYVPVPCYGKQCYIQDLCENKFGKCVCNGGLLFDKDEEYCLAPGKLVIEFIFSSLLPDQIICIFPIVVTFNHNRELVQKVSVLSKRRLIDFTLS